MNQAAIVRAARAGLGAPDSNAAAAQMDARAHVETHGQGPALLLTHGFGATCRMWDEQVEALTDRFRVILWDLPAHGRSAAPDGGAATPDQLVARMARILDGAGVQRAVLVGLGVGGLLSLRFWRAWPARVRGLVLIGTMPGLRSGPARTIWNRQAEDIAIALERDGLHALEGGAETDPHQHADPAGLAAAARALLTQNDEGALAWLGEIDVPALIVVGGEDRPCRSAGTFMARAIPGGRLVVIPRANHAANLHRPAAFNAELRALLARLPD